MTNEDKLFLDRITEFSNKVMKDINPDPRVTPISEQIEYLRPIMEEIAGETGSSLEDVFIRYMDLASEASVARSNEFDNDFADFGTIDFAKSPY
ncbi:MAG: hypothetical protein E7294_07700 [Lachnospiraceae bacterium]|jgi:hypothetical protein|nr:hypothetical protein [Lachnospiraceae bacterium]